MGDTNGVTYHGSLPQLFKVDGSYSSFVLPVYKSIFDDKPDTAKLTNKESFTIITGPTGTTTNGGKKVNRHKISLCAPGGGMIERFLKINILILHLVNLHHGQIRE